MLEIVLSDDASQDETPGKVRSVVSRHLSEGVAPALHITINTSPLGVTKNFEQAIRQCSGDLIALCDQDDVWHNDRLNTIASVFRNAPELLLLHGNADLIDDQGNTLGHSLFEALEVTAAELHMIRAGRAFDAYLRRNLATGATTVFRKSLLEVALPFPEEWLHDEWLAMIASSTGMVSVCDEVMVGYRQHNLNQVGVKRLTLAMKMRKLTSRRAELLALNLKKNTILLERLVQLPGRVTPQKLDLLKAKISHQQFRLNLPRPRLARVPAVVLAAIQGQYHRFDRGLLTMARDLLGQ